MPIRFDEMSAVPQLASEADIFLDIQASRAGKIKGESVTDGHADEIQAFGWCWGVAAGSAIGSTAATARRQYRPLVFTKGVDAASTGLLNALKSNDELKQVKLVMRKAGGQALEYLKMTLAGARVVDVEIDVDARGRAAERVTVTFTRIDIEYQAQKADGSGGGTCSFTDEVLGS